MVILLISKNSMSYLVLVRAVLETGQATICPVSGWRKKISHLQGIDTSTQARLVTILEEIEGDEGSTSGRDLLQAQVPSLIKKPLQDAEPSDIEFLEAIRASIQQGLATVVEMEAPTSKYRVDKPFLKAEFTAALERSFSGSGRFLSLVDSLRVDGGLARHVPLQQHLATVAKEYMADCETIQLHMQDAIKLERYIPARPLLEMAFSKIKETREKLDSLHGLAEQANAPDPSSEGSAVADLLLLINPLIHLSTEAIDAITVLAPGTSAETLNGEDTTTLVDLASKMQAVVAEDVFLGIVQVLFTIGTLTMEVPKTAKKERAETRKAINESISTAFLNFLKGAWPRPVDVDIESLRGEKLSAMLPKLLKVSLKAEEERIMLDAREKGMVEGKSELEKTTSRYQETIVAIGNWCDRMSSSLPVPYDSALKPIQESLEYQAEELSRFQLDIAFFFEENKKQEERYEFRQCVKEMEAKLDELLDRYENDAGDLLKEGFLDIGKLHRLMSDFKKDHAAAIEEVKAVFKDQDVTAVGSIQSELVDFIKVREERIRFINNMILVDLKETLKKIAGMVDEINEAGALAPVDVQGTGKVPSAADIEGFLANLVKKGVDLTKPVVLQRQLSVVEERLSRIEETRQDLISQKDQLTYALLDEERKDSFLEEKKVGECIICFSPITTLDGEVIQCPHCNRLGHYLCLAWWLDKHAICPVCHEKLLTPGQDYDTPLGGPAGYQ